MTEGVIAGSTGSLHVSFFRIHIKILIQTAAEHTLRINIQNFHFRQHFACLLCRLAVRLSSFGANQRSHSGIWWTELWL